MNLRGTEKTDQVPNELKTKAKRRPEDDLLRGQVDKNAI